MLERFVVDGGAANPDMRAIGGRNDLEPCVTGNAFDVLS